MLYAPDLDPVAIAIGPVKVHWYGLMYLVGFLGGWALGRWRAGRPGSTWSRDDVSDLLFYIAVGVIVGGRLGYVLFYNPAYFAQHPLEIVAIWSGGMSFHGGLLGVIAAMWLFGRRGRRGFWAVADFVAPLVPVGLGAGRIGNFINHELWGRVTDMPWGMVFQGPEAGPLPRHPSQLYQAALEGLVLFAVLWIYSRHPRPAGRVSGLFLLLYGIFRFLVEFVREPDPQLGFLAFGWVTMGQVLSLPMIVFGAWLLWRPRRSSAAA
jgi:phosphatidylglycerol:prolipoprotein diacylglycerol transferase